MAQGVAYARELGVQGTGPDAVAALRALDARAVVAPIDTAAMRIAWRDTRPVRCARVRTNASTSSRSRSCSSSKESGTPSEPFVSLDGLHPRAAGRAVVAANAAHGLSETYRYGIPAVMPSTPLAAALAPTTNAAP
jgi:hypothetical protein